MNDYEDFESYGLWIGWCLRHKIQITKKKRQRALKYFLTKTTN